MRLTTYDFALCFEIALQKEEAQQDRLVANLREGSEEMTRLQALRDREVNDLKEQEAVLRAAISGESEEVVAEVLTEGVALRAAAQAEGMG